MATYVLLLKKLENEVEVVYSFGPNEECMGEIAFNKLTEDFKELKQVPGLTSDFYFVRAVSAIAKAYTNGQGFPDKTFFAS